jgi:hypothetical protein
MPKAFSSWSMKSCLSDFDASSVDAAIDLLDDGGSASASPLVPTGKAGALDESITITVSPSCERSAEATELIDKVPKGFISASLAATSDGGR